MTNPDRDELVKLADYFNDAPDSHASVAINVPKQRALVVTALRRLASSDGGVKVRELEWNEFDRADVYDVTDCHGQGPRKYVLARGSAIVGYFDEIDSAKSHAQADYEARIKSALVEVPAVKGEPEPVAGERISRLAADLVVSGWMAGDHGIELAKRRAERKLLEFACDEIERHMRSHTAPPADAGMREALKAAQECIARETTRCIRLEQTIRDTIQSLERGSTSAPVVECLKAALTAPGATTKSDGESFVTTNPDGSVTLDAYAGKSRDELKARCRELCSALNEWQFIAMEAATAHGNCLSNVPEHARAKIASMIEAYRDNDKPSPSDLSSTRSEVTVDELAAFVRWSEPDGGAIARALLDQFEIRRKS